jgi:hypothetical protein
VRNGGAQDSPDKAGHIEGDDLRKYGIAWSYHCSPFSFKVCETNL